MHAYAKKKITKKSTQNMQKKVKIQVNPHIREDASIIVEIRNGKFDQAVGIFSVVVQTPE